MKPEEHTQRRGGWSESLALVAWLTIAVAAPAAFVWFHAGGLGESGGAALAGDRPAAVRPEQALAEHRARAREWLESYGWIDREGGIARVPIEEGMRAVLREGLPAREEIEEDR